MDAENGTEGLQGNGRYRYYALHQALMPGSCPHNLNERMEVVSFDDKIPVENEPFSAWGYVEYYRQLTPDEYEAYEMKPATVDHFNGLILPDQCYSVLPDTGELIIIKKGEEGYYPTTLTPGSREENREMADAFNERYGVSKMQEEAMLGGSMFGWDTPYCKEHEPISVAVISAVNARTEKAEPKEEVSL